MRNGMEHRCASIRCTPLTVLEIEEDIERTKRMMVDEARAAIEDDDAEAILLGCAGLGPIDKTMREALGVPVLDGTACAIKLVEGLHAYGLKTAKVKAYLAPEPKELVACPPSFGPVYARERAMASI
jgi:allantoin racemase